MTATVLYHLTDLPWTCMQGKVYMTGRYYGNLAAPPFTLTTVDDETAKAFSLEFNNNTICPTAPPTFAPTAAPTAPTAQPTHAPSAAPTEVRLGPGGARPAFVVLSHSFHHRVPSPASSMMVRSLFTFPPCFSRPR